METEQNQVEETQEAQESYSEGEGQEPEQEMETQEAQPQTETHVPYDRFKEVNDKNRQLEGEMAQLRQYFYQQAQRQQPQSQQGPQEVFNPDTDRGIEQITRRIVDPLVSQFSNENNALKVSLIEQEMGKDPNWATYRQEVNQKFHELGLTQAGLRIDSVEQGTNLAKGVLNMVLAEKGILRSEGQKAERQAAEKGRMQRLAATAPSGQAPRSKEGDVAFDDMSYEQREAYRDRILQGKSP